MGSIKDNAPNEEHSNDDISDILSNISNREPTQKKPPDPIKKSNLEAPSKMGDIVDKHLQGDLFDRQSALDKLAGELPPVTDNDITDIRKQFCDFAGVQALLMVVSKLDHPKELIEIIVDGFCREYKIVIMRQFEQHEMDSTKNSAYATALTADVLNSIAQRTKNKEIKELEYFKEHIMKQLLNLMDADDGLTDF